MLPKIAIGAIILIIFGLIFFDVGFITSKYIKPNIPFMNSASQNAKAGLGSITGSLHINGVVPSGATINIAFREHGTTGNFTDFAQGVNASDDTTWDFNQAEEGKSYQLQANLIVNGKVITTSDTISVTAPATEEVLTLNLQSDTVDQTQTATISGTLYINGYIPQGAVFDLLGRAYGSTGNYSVVVDNLTAQVKRTLTYSNAVSGQKYEVLGQLLDASGNIIGTSSPLVISAPSDNAEMTINSTAQPPAGTVTQISNNTGAPAPQASTSPTGGNATVAGTINFNGSAPSGSTIVILAKQPSDQNYNVVVNGITPQNGSTWSWGGATSGVTYNMVAVLKGQVNGDQNVDYADSQTYTVAAPAQNQLFTLNTGISMGAPTGSVSINCGTKGSNNVWINNTVNFSTVTGAQYYSFQIGSTSGGSDIANISQAAQSTTNQTINISNLNDSVIYYAQYAVSSVTNPTPAQYSPYSGAYTIKCPN